MDDVEESFGKRVRMIGGKKVSVYPSPEPDAPVVYLNTFADEADRVRAAMGDDCPAFTLVSVDGLDWDHDMAPWDAPPLSAEDTPCTGGADEYLQLLLREIMPAAEEQVPGRVRWRGIAGYSLAGLFALYSLYRTDAFSRAASMSGSLWFPGLVEYASSHEMKRRPDRVFLSLGDRECKTANPFLSTVQKRTEEIERLYRSAGLDVLYRLNPGGHAANGVERTAAGIRWLLEDRA